MNKQYELSNIFVNGEVILNNYLIKLIINDVYNDRIVIAIPQFYKEYEFTVKEYEHFMRNEILKDKINKLKNKSSQS